MDAWKAASLINENVSYKPGFRIRATPNRDGAVMLSCEAVVADSSRYQAPGYRSPIIASSRSTVNVGACSDETEVYAKVLKFLIEMEIHESREFFKVGNDYEPPFHPHTYEGKRNFQMPRDFETR